MSRIPWWFVWPSLVIVASPAFYALAYCQHRLFADLMPWAPDAMTYGLSGMVDVFGIVMGVYWLMEDDASIRRWGRVFTIAAVVASTALTCVAIGRLSGWGPAVLGLFPAFAVFATTKMVTKWQELHGRRRDAVADADARASVAEARTELVEQQAAEQEAALAARLDELTARLEAAEARPVSIAEGATEDTGPLPVQRPAARGRVSHIADKRPKKERAEEFVLAYRGEHGKSPTGQQVDTEVGGKGTGRSVLADMRRRGVIPPPEREPAERSA